MPSPNFSFLSPTFPMLDGLASTAETCAASDPSAAIVKLRQFGEEIARRICAYEGIEFDEKPDQFERLQAIGSSGIIPRSIVDLLHRLRMAGNAAAHEGSGTPEQTLVLLRDAFTIACWFRVKFAPALREPPEEYVVVAPPDQSVDLLRDEVEALRALVAESLAENEEDLPLELAAELEQLLAPHKERYEAELAALRADVEKLRSARSADAGSAAPACPVSGCGARMEVATAAKAVARHGIAIGDPIWRCSRFPECKGWRMYEGERKVSTTVPSVGESLNEPNTPSSPKRRAWAEFGVRDGWDVSYLNCGGRLRATDLTERLTDPERRALGQVVVFAAREWHEDVSERTRLVASIFRRLLGRGLLPPVDPMVEEQILDAAGLLAQTHPARNPGDISRVLGRAQGLPPLAAVRAALRYRADFIPDTAGRQPDGSDLLHEDAELPFFRDWLPERLANGAGQWWHHQASLDSLVSEPEPGARRVDFMCATPDGTLAIEIDGDQHVDAAAVDAVRDTALRRVGIGVARIPAAEVRAGDGPALENLLSITPRLKVETQDPQAMFLVWGPAIANRIALGIVEALERGWLDANQWELLVDAPVSGAPMSIVTSAVRSAVEILIALAGVWGAPIQPESVLIRHGDGVTLLRHAGEGRFTQESATDPTGTARDAVRISVEPFHGPFHLLEPPQARQVVIRSTYLPVHLVDERQPGGMRVLVESPASIPGWSLRRLLQGIFAKREFQPDGPHPRGQEVAIRRLLAGHDSVVLLPTGAGKSLIYQLAALLMPGLTLVIDPIIALIDDQIDGLRRHGIDRSVGISSADKALGTAGEKLSQIQSGDALFVFVSPERMQERRFREVLRTMSVATPISLLVVDEAHCVSEWGHDFRTAYLDIGRVLRQVSADREGTPPPLLALTGTASRAVLKDMLIELSVDRADPDIVITPVNFDRPELRYFVVNAEDDELIPRLVGTLNGLPSMFSSSRVPRTSIEFFKPRGDDSACGIIFCQTINERRGVVTVSQAISDAWHREVPIYSGKAPKGWKNFDQLKRRNAESFKENESTLLVATKAYGMGIDKPNIRYIIHAGIPSSIEGYYQEAGRAGRDRRESVCVIVNCPSARKTIDYFHEGTFVGIAREAKSLDDLLESLLPAESGRMVGVPFADPRENRERAIHRLKLLGVVRDYTVDWGGKRYDVKLRDVTLDEVDASLINFVRRNQPGRVPDFEQRVRLDAPVNLQERISSRARMMIEYVYDTIVSSRLRAVDEMERLAQDGHTDALIRDRILRYLALGHVAEKVEELLEREPFHFADWMSLLDAVESSDDAREWRGATSRMLESDPDNPGLLLGRGFAEAAVPAGDAGLFSSSVVSAIRSATTGYFVGIVEVSELLDWLSRWLTIRKPDWRPLLYAVTERALPDDADRLLAPLEEAVLDDPEPLAAELDVVLARRLRKTSRSVNELVQRFQETR